MSDTSASDTNLPSGSEVPPMDRVRQEMERWLEVARTTGERALETLGLSQFGRPTIPAVDVIELDAEIIVLADLPGVAAEFVQLSLVGNMLVIKAARQGLDVPESARRHIFERTATQFERPIPLPAPVDPDDIRAETRDGLLTVTLRKMVASVGRSIPVVRAGAPKPTGAP